eukprot:GHVU01096965.1.p1 GENE.GHVU01096965.1~~GHVU01096965.1.p1  ORF type:complete len:145 (-),score=10.85 GHVU01096965.1:205-639(-)
MAKYWKPGQPPPGRGVSLAALGASDDGIAVYNPLRGLPIKHQREKLPVYKYRLNFLWSVETHRVVIVLADTGSGKSTQLCQYLDEAGWAVDGKTIVVTQPRRVGALTICARVAEEMGVDVGREVGALVAYLLTYSAIDHRCVRA